MYTYMIVDLIFILSSYVNITMVLDSYHQYMDQWACSDPIDDPPSRSWTATPDPGAERNHVGPISPVFDIYKKKLDKQA